MLCINSSQCEVDFRSDWALSWERPMSHLDQQMFFARKRSANEAAAAPRLVTKALSQDVMFLGFVPLSALHGILFNKYHPQLLWWDNEYLSL